MGFGHWLRKNAEKHLQEAAADDLIARYPESCEQPYREKGLSNIFWRNIFVPIYLLIPWSVRKKIILASSYPGGKRPHWKKYK